MPSKQRPADPVVVVEATGEPAFAVDCEGAIIAWNKALEGLLGYPADQVVGKRCADVICGRDVFGNRYCQESCPVRQTILRNEPVNSFEIYTHDASRAAVRVVVTTVLVRTAEATRFVTVHLLHQTTAAGVHADGAESEEFSNGAKRNGDGECAAADENFVLTARELEVLGHLAAGSTMKVAASNLHISVSTVRSHSQNILRKVGASNLRHAIAIAMSLNVI